MMEHRVQHQRQRQKSGSGFRERNKRGDRNGGSQYYSGAMSGEEDLTESMLQMTLQGQSAQGYLSGYPERPGQPDCAHFMRTGFCGYGINCRYNHPIAINQVDQNKSSLPDCQFYLKTGTCKFGRLCKYLHPDRSGLGHARLNELGFPMRMGEKECTYYMRTGSCKYGASCKFHHPQPGAWGAYVPATGSSVYGTAGSPLVPSPVIQYSHSLSTWPSSQNPHIQGSHIPGLPPYVPVIYSPQQGIPSAPLWGMQQNPAGPMTSSERQQLQGMNILSGSAQLNHPLIGTVQGIYPSFLQGPSMTVLHPPGQYMAATNQRETYPERPGQPECQYYIKTGHCKFGTSCRYHHPQGGVSESSPCVLSPIGLPVRPSQPTCTFYNRYGICKFGPICKFDHPMTGISYSPSSSSLSELPVAPYPSVSSPATTLVQSPSSSSGTLQEIGKNRDQILKDSPSSKQDDGTAHAEGTAALKDSASSDAYVLSETARN